MKILFCSSGPYSGSGYGTQVYHLMKHFTKKKHVVGLIATDFGKLIDFQKKPYRFSELVNLKKFNIEKNISDLPDYPIYPILDNEYGWDVIKQHSIHFQADVVIFFRDPWKILDIKSPVEIPENLFTWIPIDHDPVSLTLIKCVKVIPNLVSMADFGYRQLMQNGLNNTMIPHCIGIDSRVEEYRSKKKLHILKNEIREQFQQKYSTLRFSEYHPVVLIMLTNNQFPSRKAIDSNLSGLRKFVKNYPETKIIIHSNMNGIENNRKEGIDMNYICKYLDFPLSMIWVPYGSKIVSRKEITDLYLISDILLHCSAGEGFGVPIIESQYYGCSVVTNHCTAMPEITVNGVCVNNNQKIYVNNVNSFWYYPNPDDISKALLQIASREEILNKFLLHSGSQFISEYFNTEVVGDKWLKLLQSKSNNNPNWLTVTAKKI